MKNRNATPELVEGSLSSLNFASPQAADIAKSERSLQIVDQARDDFEVFAGAFSEVLLCPHGAWDFPMSQREKDQLLVDTFESALENSSKVNHWEDVDIAGMRIAFGVNREALDARACFWDRFGSFDIPLSQAEKVRRLTYLLSCQVQEHVNIDL
jgi:hypothetical protein